MSKTEYLAIPSLPVRVIDRFFSKVEVDPKTKCWNWTAWKTRGYGQFWFNGKDIPAHRFTYSWLRGPVPLGISARTLQLDHIVCDNRGCVNPWHTKLVLPRDNNLRGKGPAAMNAKKTHCPNGHSYKVRLTGPHAGRRDCHTCANNQ